MLHHTLLETPMRTLRIDYTHPLRFSSLPSLALALKSLLANDRMV